MKSVLFFLIVVVVFASVSGAAQYYFFHDPDYLTDGTDPNDWANVKNWQSPYGTPATVVPTIADYVSTFYDPNLPQFTCVVKNDAFAKYLNCYSTGHMIIKDNAKLKVERQWTFVYTQDANIGGVMTKTLGTVDVEAGSSIEIGKVGLKASENLVVGHVHSGILNLAGTVTALVPTDNTMTISYGHPDPNGNIIPGNSAVNMSGNAQISGFRGIYLTVCGGNEIGVLNVLDNSTVSCEILYNSSGIATINVEDNGLINCKNLISPWGSVTPLGETLAAGTINISGNGRVIVGGGTNVPDFDPEGGFNIKCLGNYVMCAVVGYGYGPRYSGTLNIMDDNSVFDCNGAMIGEGGPATINIYGGTFDCNELLLTYPEAWKGELGACQINLFGGTLTVKQNWLPGYNSARDGGNDNSHVDIRYSGKLVLPYSQKTEITADIALGIIEAYGGVGSLVVVDNVGAGTVTITALSGCGLTVGIVGDVNGDCDVDFSDVRELALTWLATSGPADLNADLRVNMKDFALIMSNWLYEN